MQTTLIAILIFVSHAFLQCAIAQEPYPTKPIRIIVPFSPGGINDFSARSISTELSAVLKVPVVVDNRAGAGGIVGTKIAAAAPPDGYTLVVGSVASHAIKQSLFKNPPYDVLRDFEAVVHIADTPLVVVVHPSLPVHSIRQLIAFAKKAQAPLSYASSGIGTATHLATELFAVMAGVRFVHIPYKGAGPAIIDLIGGQVLLMFATMPSALPQVNAGRLRALAVTSARRYPSTPKLPTVAEEGVPGYAVTSWSGMFAPAGTPKTVVTRLAREVDKILQTPATKNHFFSQGAEPVGGSPVEFAVFVKDEITKWKKVVELSGATAD